MLYLFHSRVLGYDGVLVHNTCDPNIQKQTEFLDENIGLHIPVKPIACYLCAVKAALDPQFKGQPRAIVEFTEKGHAVLGIGENIDDMIIIDQSPFVKVFGGTIISMKEYSKNMGSPTILSLERVQGLVDKLRRGSQFGE